ncbi:conserved Plasmodium protein, unknown function [Plasmodium gallinaceum]|uniref:Uncharacterized protein n=1 Tax=Plasmodium gallinaceum TaxID=5849 RepID=A0A1J1GUT1_PLAGA|nr:conserved Plasmodium protein, unknown function [Plasmodium gallinaceum]CRG96237.1 conserved Plasmodium protein, unknown function [Plasmodium gallinaceum]
MNIFYHISFFLEILLFFTNYVYSNYNIKTNKLIFEDKTEQCKKSIYLYGEKESFIIASKDNVYLEIQDNKTIINSLNIYGKLHTNDFLFFENKQWKLFHLNTFDVNDNSWIPSEISTCRNSPDSFLGGPCKFGATEAYTKINNLPYHKKLNIKLRVHFFDKWDNDSLFLQVDNKTMWTQSHELCPEGNCLLGIDVCGQNHPDRLSVPIDIQFQHSSDTLNILIGSTLKKTTDPCLTSWGVDDFMIYYK